MLISRRCHSAEGYISFRALSEFECSEVYPCASSHLLVHYELGLAAEVMHCVMCRRSALRKRFVRNVYGVFASFRYLRTPLGFRLVPGAIHHAVSDAYRTCPERIFHSRVIWLQGCKSCSCILPLAFFLVICASICFIDHIEISYDLVSLHVSFPRKHHIGSCIFKHRDKIGKYEALGKHIFNGLEQAWPLPHPSSCAVIIVTSVTLPYGYRSVRESFAE